MKSFLRILIGLGFAFFIYREAGFATAIFSLLVLVRGEIDSKIIRKQWETIRQLYKMAEQKEENK